MGNKKHGHARTDLSTGRYNTGTPCLSHQNDNAAPIPPTTTSLPRYLPAKSHSSCTRIADVSKHHNQNGSNSVKHAHQRRSSTILSSPHSPAATRQTHAPLLPAQCLHSPATENRCSWFLCRRLRGNNALFEIIVNS